MVEVRHTTVLDTSVQHLGKVYGKALLGAAEKAGVSSTVLDELDSVVDDVLPRLPQLESLLASPRVPADTKEAILDRAFQGRMSPLLLNFLKVLTRRRRFECLRAVRNALHELYNELHGRVDVDVRTAVELDPDAIALVTNRLKAALNREVRIAVTLDPDIVAGLVIRVGDTVYDGSVARQLQQLRSEVLSRAGQTLRTATDRFASAD